MFLKPSQIEHVDRVIISDSYMRAFIGSTYILTLKIFINRSLNGKRDDRPASKSFSNIKISKILFIAL